MARVRVIHWRAEEAGGLLAAVRSAGHEPEFESTAVPPTLRTIKAAPPSAVVIDLSRLPSHGREVATYIRTTQATRQIPIVFVNGEPGKIEAVRQTLPDAVYTTTADLPSALREALVTPPAEPVVPVKMMDRFAGRTAAEKLGLKENTAVALLDAPREYAKILGEVAPGVTFHEDAADPVGVTLWFVQDAEAYRAQLPAQRRRAAKSKFWVLFPKQSAGKGSGINQNLIRETALELGLVDYKVCSVNSVWSGMCFAAKK